MMEGKMPTSRDYFQNKEHCKYLPLYQAHGAGGGAGALREAKGKLQLCVSPTTRDSLRCKFQGLEDIWILPSLL